MVLKTTSAPITDNGEIQNWELVPKLVEEVKEREQMITPQLNLKEKENIVAKEGRGRKRGKKSVIVPEPIPDPVLSTSRFGRPRIAKKFP